MKKEIRQNGKSILWSDDGVTIDIIFRNLKGLNFKGKEYINYIQYIALPETGFDLHFKTTIFYHLIKKIMNREEKKQARIERYEELSHKSMQNSNNAYEQSYNMTSVIPFGQPILVGHHSEARHRNLMNRSWNKMGESVKLWEKAEYYQQKAEAAANNNAIYLDDTNVVEKLEEKIAGLEKLQEQMKQTNKIIRATKTTKEQKMELLKQLGLSDKVIDELFSQKYTREIGFPSYSLTNNNANLRRLKQRLEEAKQLKGTEEKEYEINGVRVVENTPENRLQLFFESKPDEETRKKLKAMGFRWSPTNGCWQSYYNQGQIKCAKEILENL